MNVTARNNDISIVPAITCWKNHPDNFNTIVLPAPVTVTVVRAGFATWLRSGQHVANVS